MFALIHWIFVIIIALKVIRKNHPSTMFNSYSHKAVNFELYARNNCRSGLTKRVIIVLAILLFSFCQPSIEQVQIRNQVNGRQCFNRSASTNQAPNGLLRLAVSDPIQNFQSGSKTIVNSNQDGEGTQIQSNRYNCFNISFLYLNQSPTGTEYEVVVSIQNIESYQDSDGLDFSVRIIHKYPTYIQGLFVMSGTARWTQVELHYIVTTRNDFRVGEFVPSTGQLLGLGLQNCQVSTGQSNTIRQEVDIVLEHKLVRPWEGSMNAGLIFALPFLSGIKTLDRQLNVGFGRSSFDPQTGLILIPLSTKEVQNPIQSLVVSYLIVSMESDFQITNIYDLNSIPSDINVFVGMTGVNTVAPQELEQSEIIGGNIPLGILRSQSLISTKDPTRHTSDSLRKSFHHFFDVQGLVIQSNANLDLLFSAAPESQSNLDSQPTTIECISSQRCQGYDGYMRYYQNENGYVFHSECVLCERFASFNKETQSCQCRDLYIRDLNGDCVQKRQSESSEAIKEEVSSSGCPLGFEYFEGNCYKITWGAVADQQVEDQTQNQEATLQPLPEASGSFSSLLFSSQLAETRCLSSENREVDPFDSTKCKCVSGTFLINRNCQQCHPNAFFDGTKCQCLRGFIGDGKVCTVDPSSDTNSGSSLGLVPNFIRDQMGSQRAPSPQPQNNGSSPQTNQNGINLRQQETQGAFVLGRIDLGN